MASHVCRATACMALAVAALYSSPLPADPDLEVRKSVDIPTPTPGQPVEFTVTVRNTGAIVAPSLTVKESPPPELRIPTGMAVFVSVGDFDPVANLWTVGPLAPGATATLVMPAIVAVADPPACSVNVAEIDEPYDPNPRNDRATAAVRRAAGDHCVDVAVAFEGIKLPKCGEDLRFDFLVDVTNLGPDEARNVIVDLSQSPALAPNLRLVGTGCSGSRCTIPAIGPGATVTLQVLSGEFQNNRPRTLTFGLVASSTDTDYSTTNNQARLDLTLPVSDDCDYDYYDPCDDGTCGAFYCFIATAAYGSALEPHVVVLRQFRDRHLRRTTLGRAFIRFYYRHSPPLAEFIAAHPPARFATRMLLTPLVLLIAYPLRALAIALLALALFAAWRRRQGRTCPRPRTTYL